MKVTGNGFLKLGDETLPFKCTCNNCGSENVTIENDLAMGSSYTGIYGDISISCDDCEATAVIFE